MAAVEVWGHRGKIREHALEESAYAVGSDPDSADIVLDDPTVSRVHAMLERVGNAWLIRDLGSRNGTQVGHERIVGQRRLRHRDEVLIGTMRLRFVDVPGPCTTPVDPPPSHLTRMEKAVLIELCRPLMTHNQFQSPASVREIGARLFIGKNAVQAHLVNLYDKFGIYAGEGVERRQVLANEALKRGAVSIGDLGTDLHPGGGCA